MTVPESFKVDFFKVEGIFTHRYQNANPAEKY